MTANKFGDVSVAIQAHVATVEIHRPPHNYFDDRLVRDLADAFEALDRDSECRALLLASEGRSFCAGANLQEIAGREDLSAADIYKHAVRLFACEKPVVAAIQGAAVGGGLGLALVADFRVVAPEAWFGANFVKLGIHPGFGLTHTLPRLIGVQRASLMFYTGRRIGAQEALAWGLADVLAAPPDLHSGVLHSGALRKAAHDLASEIAACAPLAVRSTRATLRRGLAEAVHAQTDHELAEQTRLFQTQDHKEGVLSVRERRQGRFTGS
ncbi:MAG TPA: enoyl-CoA hydratase/isomerase family protein [Candidatus Angelobacter sp.]|nr:enoyl-CoA hydratase/isomerase family protein [Candidatus Angelobacter sp.]